MAEPSLLCFNCARAPPPHRRTWDRCTLCVERNLPSTYYCGEECMNAHWPKHKVWHKEQKEWVREMREGGVRDVELSVADEQAQFAEMTGSELAKRTAAALTLTAEGDIHAAAKAWRKIIKEWPEPEAYCNLAITLQRSNYNAEAVLMHLKAMELYEDGTKDWAESVASAFDVLKQPDCCEAPKPEWWNDAGLKALSARVVALVPDSYKTCAMRACVLSGDAVFCDHGHWNARPRTATEIKEAATWFGRASKLALVPADELAYERAANQCDEVADPLLAEEEAEASKARAAADAEAAEALKAAEARATAAAEELLAEEEKEKTQTSTKAGKAKNRGKKGKGKR